MCCKKNARKNYVLVMWLIFTLLTITSYGCRRAYITSISESQTLTPAINDPNRVCITIGYYDALLRARDYAVEKGYRW